MNSKPTTDDTATWPVLAQLPRVGGAHDARRIVDVPPARDQSRRQRAVDPPHGTRGYDGPPEGSAPPSRPESRPLSKTPAPKSRQVRIDAGVGLGPPARHSQAETVTLAGQAFQLHQALAPHMGLVGAAALVLSGSLLYWLAFGPAQRPTNAQGASPVGSSWSSESTPKTNATEAENAAASTSLTGHAPRVAAATAPPNGTPATGSQSSAATQPVEPAADGPTMSPADAADATNDQAATAPAGEPITPTPESASYPITSYPAFQFAEPQAVAERPSAPDASAPR